MNKLSKTLVRVKLVLFLVVLVCCTDGFQHQGNHHKRSSFRVTSTTKGRAYRTITNESLIEEGEILLPGVILDASGALCADLDRCSFMDNGERSILKVGDAHTCEGASGAHYNIGIETTYQIGPGDYLPEKNRLLEQPKLMRNTVQTLVRDTFSLYMRLLDSHALLTKTLTSGVVGGFGDIMAQCFENNMSGKSLFLFDMRRLCGIFVESTFFSGPLMHYTYDYLEHLMPVNDPRDREEKVGIISSLRTWIAATFHVIADTFLLGPLHVFSMMVIMLLFEGRIASLKLDLLNDFGPTFRASAVSSLLFMPLQVLAFKMLPTQLRLLYVNLQDILWNAVVSFAAHKSRH